MSPIRVLIVDNSVLVREALSEVLRSDSEIEIVGTASGGEKALALFPRLRPDLVTLDLALSGMSALTALAEMRKIDSALPVILFSMFSQPVGALNPELGSREPTFYIKKPTYEMTSPAAKRQFRRELIPRIKLLCRAVPVPFTLQPVSTTEARQGAGPPIEIVAIGASTGGPDALANLLVEFPADFPAAILIVQHLPPRFTQYLADRLDSLTSLRVREGKAGRKLAPAEVWIAPGDHHMVVIRHGIDAVVMTNQGPMEQGCRPSVDVLFRSVAKVFGRGVLGVVLTGMGSDGTRGAQAICDAGGKVIVQDEATSAVWGMPGRVVAAGLAHAVCPLGTMASEIMRRVRPKGQSALRTRAASAR